MTNQNKPKLSQVTTSQVSLQKEKIKSNEKKKKTKYYRDNNNVLTFSNPNRNNQSNGVNDEVGLFYFVVRIQRRHRASKFWGEGKGAVLLFYVF